MRKPLARPKIVRPKPALPPGVQAKRAQTDAVPPRDTQSKQEARSTRTRNAICEATIACLVEYGYGETTLGRVVEKAGVSNGALLHHFPSKEHLMTAAARHLLARTFERPKRRLPENPTDRDVIATDLKTNWSYYINTPQYRALLEILIALRTDKTLRQQIAPTLHAYHEEAVRHISATYESATGHPEDAELLPVMSNIFFRGLLVQDQYSADPKKLARMVERWIEIVSPLLRPRRAPLREISAAPKRRRGR